MLRETLTLGYPAKAAEMLAAGTAYREGGVVREVGNGRIVAFLTDTDSHFQEMAEANVVPLAVLGISMAMITHRLEKIEHELRAVKNELVDIKARVETANIKLDAQLIGRLIGAIKSCHLEIEANHTHRLNEYRQLFLETYHQLRIVVCEIVGRPELLRRSEMAAVRYCQAMLLAGVAARDLSFRLGQDAAAIDLTSDLHRDIDEISHTARCTLEAPSALFWRQPSHLELVLHAEEARARLKTHEEALRTLPREEIQRVSINQPT